MTNEINPANEKLIHDAFMAAMKALVAEKAESLTTKITMPIGTYLLSIDLKELDGENNADT